MALVITSRGTANTATDLAAPSATTASFTPSNNSLLVAVAISQNDGAVALPTISGGGLVWTARASLLGTTFDMNGIISSAPVTTGASMTVTAVGDAWAVGVAVVEFTGYNTSSPFGVTLAVGTGSRSGAYSPALSGTSASDSIVVAGGGSDSGTATKGASWTDIYNYTSTSGGTSHKGDIEYITGAVSAANWAALTSSFSTSALALEIKAAASTTKAPPVYRSRRMSWAKRFRWSPRKSGLIVAEHKLIVPKKGLINGPYLRRAA